MRTMRLEAGLMDSRTRDRVTNAMIQGENPAHGLCADTLMAADATGIEASTTLARFGIRPGFQPFDNGYRTVARMAAGLAVRLESAIYKVDTRGIATAFPVQVARLGFIVPEAVSRPEEVARANPYTVGILTEAARRLPCDGELRYHAAQIAVATAVVMDYEWEQRAERMANQIWTLAEAAGEVEHV